MGLLNIISLHFQQVFHHRLRSLVWFFIPLLNNLVLILFWSGALKNTIADPNWTIYTATTYYFLLTIANAMLSSHIEEDVANYDIQQGELVRYLIRPFPYYWIKFIEEIPYRILQGSYGIILLIFFSLFFGTYIRITANPLILFFSFIIAVFAFFITFTIKMNLGLSAFWFKDSRGFFELVTITLIIFSGGVVPLYLLPQAVQIISYILPFSYTAFFPIIAVQGKLQIFQLFQVIAMQLVWLGILIGLNRVLWKKGIKKFTAIGQ
ncbi:MAG: ABC-2 family transporter protein [Patescibacteria group bacterium]